MGTARTKPAHASRAAQLVAHETALRKLSAKLRSAAKRLDLAAYYAGDGATITADNIAARGIPHSRQRTVASMALEVVRALNTQRWQT